MLIQDQIRNSRLLLPMGCCGLAVNKKIQKLCPDTLTQIYSNYLRKGNRGNFYRLRQAKLENRNYKYKELLIYNSQTSLL